MHLHQALRQPDKAEFLKAKVRNIQTHDQRKRWKLVPVASVPMVVHILDSIWAKLRIRCIRTEEMRKYKARVNTHRGQHIRWISYW